MPLSGADLVRLEDEYGSLEAAAEALPEQRDEILAASHALRDGQRRAEERVRAMHNTFREQLDALNDAVDEAFAETQREPKRGPDPDPVPWELLLRAVEMRHKDGASAYAIQRATGLPKRQSERIVKLVDAGRLRLTRTGLEGVTRVDRDGAHLPRL